MTFSPSRETYRFSRSPNACPSIVSQKRASAAGMSKLYRQYLETFIIPARAFGTPRGENDGRDSQVTFSVIPRATRIRAKRRACEWSSVGTRHFSLHPTHAICWATRISLFISRQHCSEARISDRRANILRATSEIKMAHSHVGYASLICDLILPSYKNQCHSLIRSMYFNNLKYITSQNKCQCSLLSKI